MPERILITGGAGFIGASLARRLFEAGHSVRVLDKLLAQVHGDSPQETSPLLRSLDGIADVQVGDVASLDDLRVAIAGIDVVVHLAAETGTGQSMYEIDRYVSTNIGGTAKLLQVLTDEEHSVRRVVVASSRAIYGEGAYRAADGRVVYPPHRDAADMSSGDFEVHLAGYDYPLSVIPTTEDARLHPSSVYGITKQTQEALVLGTAAAIGLEAISLRYQNVYGPGQSLTNPYTGILSIFSTLIRQNEPINVFEDGLESRDFIHISDVVEATFRACVAPALPTLAINVGSGVQTTVLQVVESLLNAFDADVPVTVSGRFRVGDIRHNVADTSMAQALLGFTPKVSFVEGIRDFASWVRTQPIETTLYQRSLDELERRRLLK
ncbi:NAD-dependent epimerase/dehydratase family protein [Microbacterium dextranolyticum]|uniref:Nucleoside-diphosphate-sugar epimerase n=1 Tax=Microbacterium dextranolyticum TaxID=36806 RepID=A0A9W6HLJ4_9MICO|nr:dTDP-L-rhamnose 4-epimerase [Microbacterium dextranolyticum]GLJ94840.1 nucleoside-diphosphate-sugar epimerase [Microbacterium dextranolyticum]